jgi:hypothetical protein
MTPVAIFQGSDAWADAPARTQPRSALAFAVTTAVKLAEPSTSHRMTRSRPKLVRDSWRMPPLDRLPPARLSARSWIWMIVPRAYFAVAAGLVLLRIAQLATVGHDGAANRCGKGRPPPAVASLS